MAAYFVLVRHGALEMLAIGGLYPCAHECTRDAVRERTTPSILLGIYFVCQLLRNLGSLPANLETTRGKPWRSPKAVAHCIRGPGTLCSHQ